MGAGQEGGGFVVSWRAKKEAGRTWRARKEGGATLVEFAIVLPLLLLILLGIVEIGLAFKDTLTVSLAAKDGARVLATKGNDADADCSALLAASQSLGIASSAGGITQIEIYKASETTGEPIGGTINTYTPGQFPPDETYCDPIGHPGKWNGALWNNVTWPPANRNIESSSLDIAGMRITFAHDWITGFGPFSGTLTIERDAITRLEPEVYG